MGTWKLRDGGKRSRCLDLKNEAEDGVAQVKVIMPCVSPIFIVSIRQVLDGGFF